MNIRSIDLQVLIPRATEASKVQQTADNQSALQQQQNAAQWEQIAAARQQQVQRTPQGSGPKIEADGQDRGRRRDADRRKGGRRRAGDEADDSPDPLRGHNIDIKT